MAPGASFTLNVTQGKEVGAVPESHVHSLKEVVFHKPTWCDACKSFCHSPYGYQCVDCRLRIHTSCVGIVGKCVLVGDETSLESLSGPSVDNGLQNDLGMQLPEAPRMPPQNVIVAARLLTGAEYNVALRSDDTVSTMRKRLLVQEMQSMLPLERLELWHGKMKLPNAPSDNITLAEIGVHSGSVLTAIVLPEEQFEGSTRSVPQQSAAIMEIFDMYDTDGDGVITKAELAALFHELSPECDPTPILQRMDTNGDGQIQYEEFVKFIFSIDIEGKEDRATVIEAALAE